MPSLKNGIKEMVEETQPKRYPVGTSREYTDEVNKHYNDSLPLLKEKGYDVDAFTQEGVADLLDELFKGSDADEEMQGFYKKGDYDSGNKMWNEKYKPTFDALMSAYDKLYNDYWLKNAPMGYKD